MYPSPFVNEVVHFWDLKRPTAKALEYQALVFINHPLAMLDQKIAIKFVTVPVLDFKSVDKQ